MALTLLRRRRIAPMREAPPRLTRTRDPITPLSDDYLVEGEDVTDQPSTAERVVHSLQIVLIIVLAVLALAIVWLLGLVFNIF